MRLCHQRHRLYPDFIAFSAADVRGRFYEARDRVQGFVAVRSEVGKVAWWLVSSAEL
jgi:hypothetical protein